jgi:hypothetical protein
MSTKKKRPPNKRTATKRKTEAEYQEREAIANALASLVTSQAKGKTAPLVDAIKHCKFRELYAAIKILEQRSKDPLQSFTIEATHHRLRWLADHMEEIFDRPANKADLVRIFGILNREAELPPITNAPQLWKKIGLADLPRNISQRPLSRATVLKRHREWMERIRDTVAQVRDKGIL